MKIFKLIPVAFRHCKDDDGWLVAEIPARHYDYNPQTQKVEDVYGGVLELERYLSQGWQIVSVQTTPHPACDAVPGAVLSQYLLSIELPDGQAVKG